MAIYHLSSGFISRSTGRSSVQNAAYITGEKLHESRRDVDVNYQNRASDIALTSTLIPNHAPKDFAHLSIWDKIETFEDAYAMQRFPNGEIAREKYMKSCQTAMTMIVAIPKELSLDSSKELIEDFLIERFISRGLICTYAIHKDAGNPHAHFLISRRSLNEKGEFSWLKDREICTRRELLKTRSLWADKTNYYLEREGIESRITEKSFLDLGINLKPTKHHGWYADKLIKDGKSSRIKIENDAVFIENKQKIEIKPSVILDEITAKQATFSQMHLLRHIQKRVGDDVAMVSYVFEDCLKEAIHVGTHINSELRYTSKTYLTHEEDAFRLLNDFNQREFKQTITPRDINNTLQKSYDSLSLEQKEAVCGLVKDNALSVLIGRAGSGKTTTLRAVADIYKASGFQVRGCSLSALACENLGYEANISASTLHSLLYKLDALKEADQKFLSFSSIMEEGVFKQLDWYQNLKRYENARLSSKTVIIVDEAGMVGTKLWQSLLSHAKESGSKIIAVGDDNQFKAIDAGDFFRAIKNHAKDAAFELSTIRRQKVDWMKEASTSFSTLDVQEGLNAYHKNGCVHETDHKNMATDMAKDYMSFIKQGKDVAVLAYTNAQTQTLNEEIRTSLKAQGRIGDECFKITDKAFHTNDKIVFLKNDKFNVTITNEEGEKIPGAFIKNGTTGVLRSSNKEGHVCVEIKNNQFAHFNVKTYQNIDYGYALTIHKSQGQTVDVALIAASKNLETKALYVAMTRHRDEAHLYYAKEDFKTLNHMKIACSTFFDKDLVKDYTIKQDNEGAFLRVQDYKMCVIDAASLLKDKNACDGSAYHAIKQEQIALGKEILKDFDAHRLYLNQSSLTSEMLKIAVGEKKRPLSLLEEQAKMRVELYGETAREARALWTTLKHKDLNLHKEQYEYFQSLRLERNHLAKDILENYRLHAPFVKEYQKEYGISQKTMKNHVETLKIEKPFLKEEKELNTLSKPTPLTPFHQTPHDIVRGLNTEIKDIATHFLGQPTHQSQREWRYGAKGSLCLKVNGAKQGLYANFETGESGNVVKFIADQLGVERKEAFKWGVDYLNLGQRSFKKESISLIEKNEGYKTSQHTWTPTYPIRVPYPDLRKEKQLAYMLKGRHEVKRFEYKDADKNILGYVVRLEDKDGHKITPTLTYCQNEKGQKQWRFQGFGNDRPLYGLDVLKEKQDAPVLIVEGEKTCEHARHIFKDHAVITWSGGCGAVQKSDWSPLKGRNITIWPDHDKAGLNAARKIANILKDQDIKSIAIVDLPAELPHKWNLADRLPQSITHQELMNNKLSIVEKETKEISSPVIKEITSEHVNDIYQKFELYRFQPKLSTHQTALANHIYDNLKMGYQIIRKEAPNHAKDHAIIQSVLYDVAKKHYDLEEQSPLDRFQPLKEIALFATQKFMENPNYYLHEDKSLLIIHAQKEMQAQHLENEKIWSALHQKNPEINIHVYKAYVEISVGIMLSTQEKIPDDMKDHLLKMCHHISTFIEKDTILSKIDDRHKEVLIHQGVTNKVCDRSLTDEQAITKAVQKTVEMEKQIVQTKIMETQFMERGFER